MNPSSADYVKYRLERSDEAHRVAKLAFQNGDFHEAVSSLYYACFHAVSALLLLEGHVTKKHKGLAAFLDLHWIKTGRLPRDLGRFYHEIFEMRLNADYKDFVVLENERVSDLFERGAEFVSAVRTQIQTLLQDKV